MSELPAKWSTTTLEEICTKISDGTHHSPKVQHAEFAPGRFKYVTSKNIRPWGLDLEDVTYVDEAVHREIFDRCNPEFGDVLLTKDGVNTGVVAINSAHEEISLLSSVALLKIHRALVDARFVKHYISSPDGSRALLGSMTGTAIRRIILREIKEATIPLPPLNEQKRIVAKIEELFSELDAGEESLRTARRQLGVYRQSLLKQAFEGKLTAKWRTQNIDKRPTEWKRVAIADIGRIETGTTPPTADPLNYDGELPFFKPTDLEQGRFVRTAREHLSEAGLRRARVLPAGSVLVTCIGATIGKTGLAQTPCATNQQINSISPAEDTLPEFAYYQVISPQFQAQIKTNASSTTLPILNKSKFCALPFVRCSLAEQQEIVRLLDAQFEAIEHNERELDAALQHSAALRQAILKKAFTGQLVPQDPADEPASALLARLRANVVAYPDPTPAARLVAEAPGRSRKPSRRR